VERRSGLAAPEFAQTQFELEKPKWSDARDHSLAFPVSIKQGQAIVVLWPHC